jgi:hypothetical protein
MDSYLLYKIIKEALFILVGGFSFIYIIKVYAGEDKKLDKKEFKEFAAFGFFLWAAVYIILKEANREREAHLFSEIWIFFILSGLLTSLSLDRIFKALTELFQAMGRSRLAKPEEKEQKEEENN